MLYKYINVLFFTLITSTTLQPSTSQEDKYPHARDWVKELLGYPRPEVEEQKREPFNPESLRLRSDVFVKTDETTRQFFVRLMNHDPLYQEVHEFSYGSQRKISRNCKLSNGWTAVDFCMSQYNKGREEQFMSQVEMLMQEGFIVDERNFHAAEFLLRDPSNPRLSVRKQKFLASVYDHVQEKSEFFIESRMQNISKMRRGLGDDVTIKWTDEQLFIKAAQRNDTKTMQALVEQKKVTNPNCSDNCMDAISTATANCHPAVILKAVELKAQVTGYHLESALLRREMIRAAKADPMERYTGNPDDEEKISIIINILARHCPTQAISKETWGIVSLLQSWKTK